MLDPHSGPIDDEAAGFRWIGLDVELDLIAGGELSQMSALTEALESASTARSQRISRDAGYDQVAPPR